MNAVSHLSVEVKTIEEAATRVLDEYAKLTGAPSVIDVRIPASPEGRLASSDTLERTIRTVHATRLAAAGQFGVKPPSLVGLKVELAWCDARGSRLEVWL